MPDNKPVLYGGSTCPPCLEVWDFIQANNLDVDQRWVLARMDTKTYDKYYITVSSGLRVDDIAGVPTLHDEGGVFEGSTKIIAHLKDKYKLL